MTDKFATEAIRRITRNEKNAITDVIANPAQIAISAASLILENPDDADANRNRARAVIRAMNKQKIDLHELLYGVIEVNAHVRDAEQCERVSRDAHLGGVRDGK